MNNKRRSNIKKCIYCGRLAVKIDDYIQDSDLIHSERCLFCKALNFATIKPL